ncbi:hypothetical protein JXA40_05830 [bacterium]|nr:hypothetical protein [candidate division CSSED10-310 bacterium]
MKKSIFVVIVISVAGCYAHPVFGERIDDMTVIENGRVRAEQLPFDMPAEDTEWYAAEMRGMNEGYALFSASEVEDIGPFDLDTYALGGYIDLPGTTHYPYDAVMNPGGTEVWITDATTDVFYVLDRTTNVLIQTIGAGGYMTGMGFSGDGSLALGCSRDNDQIYVVDTTTYSVSHTIDNITGQGIYSVGFIAYSPMNDRFYVSQWYDQHLYEIDSSATAVLGNITIAGADLWQLVSTWDGSTLYIL